MRIIACLIAIVALLPCSGCCKQRPRETSQTHVDDRPGRRATPRQSPVGPSSESGRQSPARTLTLDLGNGVAMQCTLIPAGEFTMGSPASEAKRSNDEGPQHRVRLTHPFYVGEHEVTQAQYERVVGTNPSWFKGANNPVEQVSWNDATAFCKKLSQRTGKTVRLPTEAEWEYACRAGSTTKWCFGSDATGLGGYAWYARNSGGHRTHAAVKGRQTHAVGRKKPNAWGLHDMHGNVWEWVADWYGADYYAKSPRDDPTGPEGGTRRVLRGGGLPSSPLFCRSALRLSYLPPTGRHFFVGFRVAVAAPGQ